MGVLRDGGEEGKYSTSFFSLAGEGVGFDQIRMLSWLSLTPPTIVRFLIIFLVVIVETTS
jgi:hypothetical protein